MKTSRSLVLGAALLGSASAFAGSASPLQVSLSLPQAVVQGEGAVWVEVQVHNPGSRAVKVLRWQLPEGELQGPLFEVLDAQGRAADYTGPLVKRPAPRAEDFVQIAPGQTLSYRVDLGARYALGDGQYQVRYRGLSADVRVGELRSDTAVPLWTSGRAALPQALVPQGIDPAVGPIVYTGACTASEQTDLATAAAEASTYATKAKRYLKAMAGGTARYTTWFGAYDATRWGTVKQHYGKIDSAFKQQTLTLDCSCSDNGVYAYVYPNAPYKIYLCGAFWSAPMKGTDSKAGTLIHEMSHFTVVAGTKDHAYGQAAAKALALSDPAKAIANADSHEYFAENTPAQP